jgi:hypothetical protein
MTQTRGFLVFAIITLLAFAIWASFPLFDPNARMIRVSGKLDSASLTLDPIAGTQHQQVSIAFTFKANPKVFTLIHRHRFWADLLALPAWKYGVSTASR